MPGPAKITGDRINLRVKTGSALERLLQGRSVTNTLHAMAELIENAPQAVRDALPRREPQQPPTLEPPSVQEPQSVGPITQRRFVIGHDEHTTREVDEREVLALVAEQMPTGLVPVGVDVDDEATLTGSTGDADGDELSHLE